ncbi:MAG TPA: hypothetical protein VKU01_18160 [Bryobacteraceae bacterium]|nr:hypothetical protein [Bryobacteraceae bacterium]
MARTVFLALAAAGFLTGAEVDWPTGHRTTPPTLSFVSPVGVPRGVATEITVEGLNLAKASAIYFSEPAVTGKILRVKELPDLPEVRLGENGTLSTIDLGPLPPRNQVTIEVEVSPDAEIGPVAFRLQTPLGTSPVGRFLVEPYYGETPDKEPNDTAENAVQTLLPTILNGTISRPGDVDYYKIEVKAGEQLVFDNGAAAIGSSLQPVVSILAEDQSLVKEFGTDGGMDAIRFAHKFEKAGTYYIRVADYQSSGRSSHFYRIKVGSFPIVTGAYPLGLQLGTSRDVALQGYDLGLATLPAKGELTPESEDTLTLRPNDSFNTLKLALGREPEIAAGQAQTVAAPITINGRLTTPENHFRFHARKDEKLVFEVNARRLGSQLDSIVEVLDANGSPIERATVRAVSQTSTALSDRDSATREIRIQDRTGLKVGDYLMIGGEIDRVENIPDSPDSDFAMESFGGQRIAYFDTSTEAHAVDKPVYKVQIHPPATKFTPNGLPLVHLYYQNDDGGPGYGKDSLVHFTAPADGDYQVRIRDVRGASGPDYAYRLTIREPRPDFRLSVGQRNPNVPVGGTIPVTVTAFRMDDFDGPIQVAFEDLPPGLKATAGVIAPGQVGTTLLLSAAASAKLDRAVPLKIAGHAGQLTRWASPEDHLKLISLAPQSDVMMTSETKVIEVEPGSSAEITVDIQRQNDFRGRVPVAVMNLPPRVKLTDLGLNGVLLNEDETRRSFKIEVLPSAEPVDQTIYVAGIVETRSSLPTVYAAPQAIELKVVRKGKPGSE